MLGFLLAAAFCASAPCALAQSGSVQFKYRAYSVTESTPAVVITVVRLGGSAGTISVDFLTHDFDGTATPGVDYVSTNGTLTFGPGVTALTFTVPILQDAVDELNETVTLELFNLVGPPDATIGGLQNATLSILDDDVCAYTVVPASRIHGPEGGTGEFAINATAGCRWTVTEPATANWVAVITLSGTGTTNVSYSVDPNPSNSPRSAALKIAGKLFTITQRGVPLPDLTKPTMAITAPAPGARLTNQPITVNGTARDAGGVTMVQARLETAAWTNGYQTAEGTTNWTLDLHGAVPGLNVIRVRAQDSAGNALELTRPVRFVVVSPLTLEIEGNGTVTGARDGQFLEVGRAYTLAATAVPARVNLFAEWGGELATNTPRLTFLMQSNLHLLARFVPNPFIAVKGAYNGLFQNETPVRHESSGFFTATTTDFGAFSAKLTLAGRVIPLSGKFAFDGRSTNTVVRPGLNPITVKLELHFEDEADSITGTLSDGNWIATLNADRATFNASTNQAPERGRYTWLLAGNSDPERAPHGFSCGTVNVDAAGRLSLAGTLADGTVLVQKVSLANNGRWPLFGRLYGGGGSILGWLRFEEAAGEDVNGRLSWIKPPLPSSRLYTNGFTFTTNFSGSAYAPATSLLNFTDGLVSFSGGNIDPEFANAVRIDPGNKVVNLGNNKLGLKLVTSTGLFNGTVNVPGTARSLPFKGALHLKAGYGAGFFTGLTQGGRVVVQPTPP